VLAPVDLPNTPENCNLVKRVTDGLQAKFSTATVKIDTTAKNIGRVLGLPGTMNSKGIASPERPHRMRKLLMPGDREILLTAAQLEMIAAWAPAKVRVQPTTNHNEGGPFTFENVEALFEGLQTKTEKDEKSFTFESDSAIDAGDGWNVRCPHDAEHSNAGADLNRSTSVWMTDRGFPVFKCLHDSPCAETGWREFIAAWGARDLQCEITGGEPDDLPNPFTWPPPLPNGCPVSTGALFMFDNKADYALFKLQAEEKPGWVHGGTWDGEDPSTWKMADFDTWEEPKKEAANWRSLFHTKEEQDNAPPITFAIRDFLQEDGITMLGALPSHNKTNVALAMVRSLLEGTPLFGYFEVLRPSKRVVYLIPESSLTPFVSRLRTFRLDQYTGDKLFYRTFSTRDNEILKLDDLRLREACQGADVFLDTAVRFMEGDENAVNEQKVFAMNLFKLLQTGTRTVTGLHHAPKGFERLDYMSLENILRGSGDIGAMLSTCWALRQLDAQKNQVYVENVKARDFVACKPFVIEGRPHLDNTGYFKMNASPGVAGSLNQNLPRREGRRGSGRPGKPNKAELLEKVLALNAAGKSNRAIGIELGLAHPTVAAWLAESKQETA
ncbi:MAG: AAA family ATPase, partial [Candidatus Sulfotelmatobacter sp.]